jgi:uncharacterized protein with HEPN domain
MKKDPAIHVTYVLESIRIIDEYVEGDNKDMFLNDRKTYDAVLRRLHTLAESATWLSKHMRDEHPEIEWDAIAAFRHVLVHEYLGSINNERVWLAITEKLPVIEKIFLAWKKNHAPT